MLLATLENIFRDSGCQRMLVGCDPERAILAFVRQLGLDGGLERCPIKAGDGTYSV